MDLSVQNVFGLLLRSRLIPADEARALLESWRGQCSDKENVADFTRWMVTNGHLTEYQANLLTRGHGDGFFLNDYRILDRLGKGRMAGVYKAVHQLGQVVAIKVLPPSKARDAHLLARFERESRLALKLNHANIVRAFHVGACNGLHYLVMECLEGETLGEVLQRRKRLPPAEAVRVAYQTLMGLQHIHEQGLVHRDLKPANLMIVPEAGTTLETTTQATVKIVDMSLARTLSEVSDTPEPAAEELRLTTEGTLLGTPDYMAPEQARDARTADIRADIYSVGCVLYHMLAGQTPFPDPNIITQMIRHASETPTPLREINPEVPDGLQQIIDWMMIKDPNKRYATPERAARSLQVFLEADASVTHEADPRMRSYLSWLEQGGSGDGTAPVAVALAAPPSGASSPEGSPRSARPTPRSTPTVRAKRKDITNVPAGSTQPPAVSSLPTAPALDVEVVSDPERPGLTLTRRDCIFFGLGAGSVLLAILLGWLLALLVRAL